MQQLQRTINIDYLTQCLWVKNSGMALLSGSGLGSLMRLQSSEGLIGPKGYISKLAHSLSQQVYVGYQPEASVPCHENVSTELHELPHHMAGDRLQNKQFKRTSNDIASEITLCYFYQLKDQPIQLRRRVLNIRMQKSWRSILEAGHHIVPHKTVWTMASNQLNSLAMAEGSVFMCICSASVFIYNCN